MGDNRHHVPGHEDERAHAKCPSGEPAINALVDMPALNVPVLPAARMYVPMPNAIKNDDDRRLVPGHNNVRAHAEPFVLDPYTLTCPWTRRHRHDNNAVNGTMMTLTDKPCTTPQCRPDNAQDDAVQAKNGTATPYTISPPSEPQGPPPCPCTPRGFCLPRNRRRRRRRRRRRPPPAVPAAALLFCLCRINSKKEGKGMLAKASR